MIISYLRLEPQVWVLEHRLMAQEVMQVTSPRNSLNGLAAPGQGSGEWGYPPDKWRDWYDAKAGITRAPLEDAEEPRTRQETEDWGPESGSCCENPITRVGPFAGGAASVRRSGQPNKQAAVWVVVHVTDQPIVAAAAALREIRLADGFGVFGEARGERGGIARHDGAPDTGMACSAHGADPAAIAAGSVWGPGLWRAFR
jgi:hypothetical protein